MNALVRKEVRLLLPTWIVALVLAIIPCWWEFSAPFCCTAGALLVSLALYGQEFSAGTFQQFLAQPIAREQLWRIKASVLFVVILSLLTVNLFSSQIGMYEKFFSKGDLILFTAAIVCLTFAALTGGLWTTIFFRQITAAFWFAVLIPLAISGTTMALVQKVLQTPQESRVPELSALVMLVVYSIAGYYWARLMFLRAQDAQWTGGTIALPKWFGWKARTVTVAKVRRGPFHALIWKELQIQQATLIFALVISMVQILEIGLRKLAFDSSHKNDFVWQILGFFWVIWFGLPFVGGSIAVAEERKYGTLESQHCLPATRGIQFLTKITVVLLLGTFLGGVMPWLLQSIGVLAGVPGEFPQLGDSWATLKAYCLISFVISFISFYASTLTRNILQAMGTSVLIAVALGTFHGWIASGAMVGTDRNLYLWFGNLPIFLAVPTLLMVMLWLGFRNYKALFVGSRLWIRSNAAVIVASLVMIVVVTALIYNRAWELFMPLEPKHGPQRLSGSISPQVFSIGRSLKVMPDGKMYFDSTTFALLPDGRLWATATNRLVESGLETEARHFTTSAPRTIEPIHLPVPIGGVFVGGSNWVKLAADSITLVGIQADGSLWRIFSESSDATRSLPRVYFPQRMSADTGWKSVVAGYSQFLALKNDGTLWGWVQNDSTPLGTGPTPFTNVARIGKDSDWLKIFASQNSFVGVKQDGSVWNWLITGKLKIVTEKAPIRWNVTGADWRDYVSFGDWKVILKEDGSLWTSGLHPLRLFGSSLLAKSGWHFQADNELFRVGNEYDWSAIVNNHLDTLFGLKRDGSILQFEPRNRLVFWKDHRLPSRYSDWLAISTMWWGQNLALAADGTLCSWPTSQTLDTRSLLGPTRKPTWTANIFNNSSETK
jgi:hypothetical protein